MGLTCRNSYRKHPGCGPYSGAERTDPGRDRCRGYASDLGICHEVELRRLELRTSCMPWNTGPFTAVRDSSPATRLSWPFVQNSPPPFTRVHCGR